MPKPAAVNMRASGCDTQTDGGAICPPSATDTPLCFFFFSFFSLATKLSEVFKKKHICVSSDPGHDRYLSVCVSVRDATLAASRTTR